MSSSIDIRTLTDGGQQPAEVARDGRRVPRAAQRSLDLAQYDFHLGAETAGDRRRRDHATRTRAASRCASSTTSTTRNPIPVPPPPEPDAQLIASLGVPAKRSRACPT